MTARQQKALAALLTAPKRSFAGTIFFRWRAGGAALCDPLGVSGHCNAGAKTDFRTLSHARTKRIC